MSILAIKNLTKSYEKFKLDSVSFEIEKGKIMGFIGRNGAGKSTTLKSMLNIVHKDSGEVLFFDKDFYKNEFLIKQKIGFVMGGVNYYSKKKIKTITKVTKTFYQNWDEEAYNRYMEMFNIDDSKTPYELSEGMKVKYSLVLALSHNAQILILDEPTSGLDPVSREDILDVFLSLAEEGKTILFSTHIISDIDKCADSITYIKKGKILASTDIESFVKQYKIVKFNNNDEIDEETKKKFIGIKKNKHGYTALIKSDSDINTGEIIDADLESIMIHIEKE